MKINKRLFILAVFILVGVSGFGVYYTKNKSSTSGTFTETIDIDGKKTKVTVSEPKNDPNIVPERGEIKNKGDIALEKKDLETLANLIPSEYKK